MIFSCFGSHKIVEVNAFVSRKHKIAILDIRKKPWKERTRNFNNFDFLIQCTYLWTFYHSFMVLCARDYNTIFYSLNFQNTLSPREGLRWLKRPKNIFHIILYTEKIDWNHNHRLLATARGFQKRIESNEERTSTLYLIFIIGPVSHASFWNEMVF